MANYTIIGGDQKEYGPITGEDLRKWISEGRLNAQSLAKADSDAEFRPLATFPELADAFAPQAAMPDAPPSLASSADWLERDYELDIGGYISRGWNLLKNNFGLLFGSFAIYLSIQIAIAIFARIPYIGPLFSIANLFITGPLIGGLYYVYIKAIRNEPAGVGEVFSGFHKAFIQLFLGYLIPALLAGLCMIPFLIIFFIKLFPVFSQVQHESPNDIASTLMSAMKSEFFVTLPIFFICMIPMMYLQISWIFTMPLVIDRQMHFWTAMKTSWKMVNKHWWQIFGLMIVIGLLNVAGVLACCVGILVTIPIGFATMMYAYETIFGESQTR